MADTGTRAPFKKEAPLDTTAPLDQQAPTDVQSTESRMRRALGLTGGPATHVVQQRPEQARQRHRFVQDGGVPVVMVNHKPETETTALRERLAALETALEVERNAHANTRRALGEQQAAAQALQTRLAHAALAHTEALENERRQRVAAQQALAESLAASVHTPKPPLRTARVTAPDPAPREAAPPSKPASRAAPDAPKPKRGRPRINPIPEPKPLRWWTPSFKAKTKA